MIDRMYRIGSGNRSIHSVSLLKNLFPGAGFEMILAWL